MNSDLRAFCKHNWGRNMISYDCMVLVQMYAGLQCLTTISYREHVVVWWTEDCLQVIVLHLVGRWMVLQQCMYNCTFFDNKITLYSFNFDLVLLLQMGEGEFLRVELIATNLTAGRDQRWKSYSWKRSEGKRNISKKITWLQFCQNSTSAPTVPHTLFWSYENLMRLNLTRPSKMDE